MSGSLLVKTLTNKIAASEDDRTADLREQRFGGHNISYFTRREGVAADR